MNDAAVDIMDYDESYSNTDAVNIINTIAGYLDVDRLQFNASFAELGATVASINETGFQKYVSDCFTDVEQMTKYHYYFSAVSVYDANDNFVTSYIRWRHFSILMTNKYAVIEGTQRLLSAEFKSIAEEFLNYFYMTGDTDSRTSTQYCGLAKSSTSIAQHRYCCKSM